ncbi:acyl-CoA dehydrogenase family protein [Cumulibacter soli]|uniref:acyl-CoA dehydrogenase family protein n=1 Tax=Cumulibacter soli TaxID=2546344 RepID=UPI001068BE44|nr:acyl-CoA dehydrogenase family protein [Cumulibacter soli]
MSSTPRGVETFGLTERERDLFLQTRELAREVLAPLDRHDGRVNREQVAALGETGLLEQLYPTGVGEQFQPASAMTICLIREALSYETVEAESGFAMQGIGGYPLVSASEDHRDAWIEKLRSGVAIAGLALTEPGAGSDAANLSLSATQRGSGWRLNGTKRWITNAPDADFYVTFARTTQGARARGISAFLVPGDAAGLSAEPIEMVSPHPLGQLDFADVAVEAEQLVGVLDDGFRPAMANLDRFRPSVGAAACGMAQAAMDETTRHTKERVAFGAPLFSQQALAHGLADAQSELAASRALVRLAAHALDAGDPEITTYSAMAKLRATETAQRVIDTAIQYHGASGLQRGHLLERLYRDVRASRIYEGANEVQRTIIARAL